MTGASSGTGYDLARACAHHGFDLVVAADSSEIREAGQRLSKLGVDVRAVQADLTTEKGVDTLYDATKAINRPVGILCANAGRGLGHAFLDQDWNEIRRVIDTNITGTCYLLQKFARDMLKGARAAFSSPARLQASFRGHARRSKTGRRLSPTASLTRFAMKSRTRA